jgi:hypothetical protein
MNDILGTPLNTVVTIYKFENLTAYSNYMDI